MKLQRYCYADDHVAGKLSLSDGTVLQTLERPWKPGMPGGMPFVSCVPDGVYNLLRHARPNGDVVLALRNPDLHVYYSSESVPAAGGRTLILLHSANYVEELRGCIAPGISMIVSENRPMVTNSRDAMRLLMDYWTAHPKEKLTIEPALGARG